MKMVTCEAMESLGILTNTIRLLTRELFVDCLHQDTLKKLFTGSQFAGVALSSLLQIGLITLTLQQEGTFPDSLIKYFT